MNTNYKTSLNGVNIIKIFEGFSKNVYYCPAGIPTIGYGHTLTDEITQLTSNGITEEEGESLLFNDLIPVENSIKKLVKIKLTQNQFDSLVSFVYNIGVGNFKSSTMLFLLNRKKVDEAGKEFRKWIYCKKKILPGLVKRRKAEERLYYYNE